MNWRLRRRSRRGRIRRGGGRREGKGRRDIGGLVQGTERGTGGDIHVLDQEIAVWIDAESDRVVWTGGEIDHEAPNEGEIGHVVLKGLKGERTSRTVQSRGETTPDERLSLKEFLHHRMIGTAKGRTVVTIAYRRRMGGDGEGLVVDLLTVIDRIEQWNTILDYVLRLPEMILDRNYHFCSGHSYTLAPFGKAFSSAVTIQDLRALPNSARAKIVKEKSRAVSCWMPWTGFADGYSLFSLFTSITNWPLLVVFDFPLLVVIAACPLFRILFANTRQLSTDTLICAKRISGPVRLLVGGLASDKRKS
jgi:hypothetical protein